jgi:hypothetical protein
MCIVGLNVYYEHDSSSVELICGFRFVIRKHRDCLLKHY